MNNETVNPMPASAPNAADGNPGEFLGECSDTEPDREPPPAGHPDDLADNETDDDTERHP